MIMSLKSTIIERDAISVDIDLENVTTSTQALMSQRMADTTTKHCTSCKGTKSARE